MEEERFLKDNEVGRLATISKDGLPHVVPVCYVYRSGGLWIATDYETVSIVISSRTVKWRW